ncbi:lysophospholipid acyltransferase family protein [bacterium]|nr:lysophospholipid acyltransferase family protein [bacterium]
MNKTIYTTPIIRHCLYAIGWLFLKIAGWKTEGKPPILDQYVLIAAPHKSNWDFPFALAIAFVSGIEVKWMGKIEMFRWPFGGFFKWLGGIPVDRSKKLNLVEQTVASFKKYSKLIVMIPPEGTRQAVEKWKTGFYYIAHGAGVPICAAFVNYKQKVGGFGPLFYTSGNIEADMKEMQGFYGRFIS